MYTLYLLILYLLLPLALSRLYLAGGRESRHGLGWKQRLGYGPHLRTTKPVLWLHAVSVGETHAAWPLVQHLQQQYPGYQLLITTVTVTGAQAVKRLYGDTVEHRYLPFDLPGPTRRFIASIRPRVLIILETEIWPTLYRACNRQDIPIVLVNARLSPKSFKGYRLLSALVRETLQYPALIAAQSQADADRFLTLGAPATRVMVTGNLKFDIAPAASIVEQGEAIRLGLANRPTLVAASTHEGEEEILLECYKDLRRRIPGCLLILVPRHPVRGAAIRSLCEQRGYRVSSHSDNKSPDTAMEIFILDVLGQLQAWLAAADVVFVGGSLVPVGGHNMLEPAALGRAIITGGYLFNFEEVARLLEQAGALYRAQDPQALTENVVRLFEDPALRQDMGERAQAVVVANRGKLDKLAHKLAGIIPEPA